MTDKEEKKKTKGNPYVAVRLQTEFFKKYIKFQRVTQMEIWERLITEYGYDFTNMQFSNLVNNKTRWSMNLVFALADIMKLSVSTLFEFDGELCKLENERWDEMKAIKRKRKEDWYAERARKKEELEKELGMDLTDYF